MDHIAAIKSFVDKNRGLILKTERYVWEHPETGYREWATNEYMKKAFQDLGYRLTEAGDIPGFYADLDTGRPGPTVCILGELDSLLCSTHPEANNETGAVHACGHNAQCAALIGVAAAFKEPGALDGMCGKIRLMAVPAEELLEIGYREELRKKGTIRYLGGKVEFVSRGYFKDVDISMMIHTSTGEQGYHFGIPKGSNGCIVKNIDYIGVASHAGGAPHRGINALYAANAGIQAVNSLRETFQDEDHIRFHPIITEGGQAVNAIPHLVKIESYVRGASIEAIKSANERVNRALAASAAAFGANVHLGDRPGYFPLNNDENLRRIAKEMMEQVVPSDKVSLNDGWSTGCTDMGDISAIMPAIHPYAAGAVGIGHGNNYYIDDPELACVNPAKALCLMAYKLLEGEGAAAKKVIAEAAPVFKTQDEFLAFIDKLMLDVDAVTYCEDGTVSIQYKNKE